MPPTPQFEELDYQETPLGDLSLRRRTVLSLDNLEVFEIVLGDGFLMSSLFTEVEVALADLGLAAASQSHHADLDVVVGGLGLGYTARAALGHRSLSSLVVVDYLQPVIDWHQKGLVPLGPGLTNDPRCSFLHGDFFELALSTGFCPDEPDKRYHAILLDIDHSTTNLLHERHATFYSTAGLEKLAAKIHPGGVFALWSDDPPHAPFMAALAEVFDTPESHVVTFHNPLQDTQSASTVYVARRI